MTFLAERAEGDARGGQAAIYAEIRRLGGVPMVALIFRHLAALPGGIEWAWDALAPAWRAGRLQQAAWRIAGAASLPTLAAIPREALAGVDVDAEGLREIRRVLDAYNRANPENLLSVLCLQRLLQGRDATAATAPASAWQPPEAPGALAPMADPASLAPDLAALLEGVSPPDDDGGARVVPSLYRHFVHRPAFLALAIARLKSPFDAGAIDGAALAIRAAMDEEAVRVVESLRAAPAPDPRIAIALARFGGIVIPRMIVVGAMLDRAVPRA